MMTIDLTEYLQDIEDRICPADEEEINGGWLDFADHRNTGEFIPAPRHKVPSDLPWPHVDINDTLEREDLAIYRELESLNQALSTGSNARLRVRANYGVGTLPSAFGTAVYVMPRDTDTLPNAIAIREEGVRACIAASLPDLNDGFLGKAWRIYGRYMDICSRYPKFSQAVYLEQPDLQGPMDVLELLWGSDLFYALYDDTDTIHEALGMITEMIDRSIRRFYEICPDRKDTCSYFSHMDRGRLVLRDDSAMNLSPEFFSEFIAPYESGLIEKYGGIVHFCGRGDHFIERLSSYKGLHGVNISQPHLNDMEIIQKFTTDRGIHLSVSAPRGFSTEGHDVRNLVFV